MSITRAEFLRLLPVALGGIEFTCTGRGITALDGPCRIAIEFSSRGERKLGALLLPTLAVRLGMEGGGRGDWEAFLRRFERTFHRGGG